jgi:hypothetical protein
MRSEYRTQRPRCYLATAELQNTGQQRPCPDEYESWHNLHAAVLCIGLGQYTLISRLPDAVGDARELHAQANAVPDCRAELLENLNTEMAIRVGIKKFFDHTGLQETQTKIVCIIFNCHGMQIGATVYLLPEGVDPNDQHCRPDKEFFALSDIFHSCHEFDSHARRLENPHVVTFVVIVDACREFCQKDFASLASSLDPESSKTPIKWALCFSCSRDSVAMDGRDGEHSPFAQGLLDRKSGIFALGVVGTLFHRATNAAGKSGLISGSGRISGSSYPARFPGCVCSTMEKRSYKNHVSRGFETAGRIGSVWTSHRLHHARMVNVARASEARATRARARAPERRTARAKPGP